MKEAWIADYCDARGTRHIKTFERKKEADAWLDAEKPRIRAGTHVPDSRSKTVAEAAEVWIEAVRRGRGDRPPAEASTLRQYTYHRDAYIVPRLGMVKLSQLTKADVVTFRDNLLGVVSRPLAKKVLTSLKGILSEALDRQLIGANVASGVRIGSISRGREKVTAPKIADIRAILTRLDKLATQANQRSARAWRRWRALLTTAIHTGMRASELRGLPWNAVDLRKAKIEVRQRADERGVIGPPKSKAGYRAINIPAELVRLLAAWKLESRGSLVFATGTGNPEALANISNRAWYPVQMAAGVSDLRRDEKGEVVRDPERRPVMKARYNFHALRHFHASLMIREGANPKEIQVEMGHSSIQVTFDLYGHLFEDADAEERAKRRSERLARALA